MKKITKLCSALLIALLGIFALASCDDGKIQIGILQLTSHPALDKANEGFVQALADNGYVNGENIKINQQNPQTDASTMAAMATTLVSKSKLILTIATDASVAVASELDIQKKDIPLLFTAVTEPISARLVNSYEAPGKNITGTSDMNPVADQIGLVKAVAPNATKVGILYTASEDNSQIQAEIAKSAIETANMTAVIKTITDATQIEATVRALINTEKVDCIYIPTDNMLAANMPQVYAATCTNTVKIPVVCGEESMVSQGGTITYGIDYYNLGYKTGLMAVKILNGEKTANELPVEFGDPTGTIANSDVLTALGITLPDTLTNLSYVELPKE